MLNLLHQSNLSHGGGFRHAWSCMVRKKMGWMPTRWSCAFALGREGCSSASARITALHASHFNRNNRDYASSLSNDTKDDPRWRNLLRIFVLCLKWNDSRNKGKNFWSKTRARPNKSGQMKLSWTRVVYLFVWEFPKSWENRLEEKRVHQDDSLSPVMEALLPSKQKLWV